MLPGVMGKYMSYSVKTKTNRSGFRQQEFAVRRRFRDFVVGCTLLPYRCMAFHLTRHLNTMCSSPAFHNAPCHCHTARDPLSARYHHIWLLPATCCSPNFDLSGEDSRTFIPI